VTTMSALAASTCSRDEGQVGASVSLTQERSCEVHTTHQSVTPTTEAYGQMQAAYDFFNRELFDRKLPTSLLTFQRKGRTGGYFASRRFVNVDGATRDEIALNPKFFRRGSFMEVMSTLVHEQMHLWQHHFGKPSSGNYHNKQWAAEMLRIGLHPSDTGRPGGRMVGRPMSHYILKDGPFELAARKLLGSMPELSWLDADPKRASAAGINGPTGVAGRRTKFQCPGCGDQAWGKASLGLLCIKCEMRLVASL
jgi:predicted SprT family Zn-dependent metalloprotease